MSVKSGKAAALGVIGAGFHASTNILPALHHSGIPIVALATRSATRSRAALDRFGFSGSAYASAAELFADSAIDGVVIVAQPGDQLSLTLAALAAGKHVFVDKPLGWNAAEARAVAQVAQAANRIVMVGFMKRYAPVYQQLRLLIESRDLGTLRTFSLRFGCDSTPFCQDEEEFLKLAAIHVVDLVRFLFGEVVTVETVSTGAGPCVALSILLEFESGVSGTLDLAGVPSRSSETEGIVVTGDNGFVTTTESASLVVHTTASPESSVATPSWKALTESSTIFTPAESAMSGAGRDLFLRGFVGELAAFAEAVEGFENVPSLTGWDNVRTMELVDRILSSALASRDRRTHTEGGVPLDDDSLLPMAFGDPGVFRDGMVHQIVQGWKTGSSTLEVAYQLSGEPLPTVGERRAVIDSAGDRVAVVEFTEVVATTLGDVTLAIASHESPSIAEWRRSHIQYFSTLSDRIRTYLGNPDWSAENPGVIVATVFRVLQQRSESAN